MPVPNEISQTDDSLVSWSPDKQKLQDTSNRNDLVSKGLYADKGTYQPIPMAQNIKAKFPLYKNIPDVKLLQLAAKRFPDIYKKPVQQVMASLSGDAKRQVAKEQYVNTMTHGALGLDEKVAEIGSDAVMGGGIPALGKYIGKPLYGAVMATLAGKKPGFMNNIKEGLTHPDQQDSPGVSFARSQNLDLNKPLDFTLATVADVSTNILLGHLLYGVPVKGATELYTGAQTVALKKLKDTMFSEFKIAGALEGDADKLSNHVVNNIYQQGFLKNNPVALSALEARIKGKLGQSIKDIVGDAKDKATDAGINPKTFYPKLLDTHIKNRLAITSRVPGEPQTDFGKQLKTDIENRPPFTPPTYTGGSAKGNLITGYRYLANENRKPIVSTTETTPKLGSTQPPTTIQPSVGKPAVASGKPATAAVVSPSVKTTPSIQPGAQLVPAIKIKEGELAIGKFGEHHDDIIARRPELKHKQHGFVDMNDPKKTFITREQGAKIVGQKEPLHSEDLPQTKPARIDKIKQIAQKHVSKKTMTFVDKGVTDKVQPLSPTAPLVNTLHNVHIETPTGDKMMTMNTKQLMDFQDSLKEENKLGIKIKDIQPLSSDDPKFKAYQDQIKKINDLRKKCQG